MKSFVEVEVIDGVVCVMMDKVTAGAFMHLVGLTSCSDRSPIGRLYDELGEDEEIKIKYDFFMKTTGNCQFTPKAICYLDIWPEENK